MRRERVENGRHFDMTGKTGLVAISCGSVKVRDELWGLRRWVIPLKHSEEM